MSTNIALRHHLGEPQISGPLAVYPIFGPQPRLRYRSLAHAVERGAYITELDGRASVNDVLITNASDQGVLLYEGGGREEVALDGAGVAVVRVRIPARGRVWLVAEAH